MEVPDLTPPAPTFPWEDGLQLLPRDLGFCFACCEDQCSSYGEAVPNNLDLLDPELTETADIILQMFLD